MNWCEIDSKAQCVRWQCGNGLTGIVPFASIAGAGYASPEEYVGSLVENSGYTQRFPSKLSSLAEPNCAEQDEIDAAKCQPEREPLEWNKPTPFDPFKGYVVKVGVSGEDLYNGNLLHRHTHVLQRFNDGSAVCGSAHLL